MTVQMKIRLGTMMFLEYFIWGAWYVTLGTWLARGLHFSGQQIGLAAGTTAVGAILAPFLVGLIADRLFATQYVLSFLHAIGAILLFYASVQTTFQPLYTLVLLYSLFFMPTLALTNSLAFRHMGDPKMQFGPIRVLGTIGWIAAGLLVGSMDLESTAQPAHLAAAISFLLAIYCLTLPATPPLAKRSTSTLSTLFPRKVLVLLRERSMAVFVAASFFICIPLQFYYAFTNLFLNELGVPNAAGKMTGGQMSELGCMLLIPWFFRRLGVKYMLVAGMGAWTLRYVLFAFGGIGNHMWMLWLGILVHGICYDFFFVTGQIYIDRKSPVELRAAAQGLITFITYGVGMFVGSWLSGAVVEHYSTANDIATVVHKWRSIWLVPAVASFAVLIVFLFSFKETEQMPAASSGATDLSPIELPI